MDKKEEYLKEIEKQIQKNKRLLYLLPYAKNFVLPFVISLALIISLGGFFATGFYFFSSLASYIFIALSCKDRYDTYQEAEEKRLKFEKGEIIKEKISTMDSTKENKIKLAKEKVNNNKLITKEKEKHKKISFKLKVAETCFKASLVTYVISVAGVILFSPYFLTGIVMATIAAKGMSKEIKIQKGKQEQSLGIINTTKRINALIEEKFTKINRVLGSKSEKEKDSKKTKEETKDKEKEPKESEKEPKESEKAKSKEEPFPSPIVELDGFFGPPGLERGKVRTKNKR